MSLKRVRNALLSALVLPGWVLLAQGDGFAATEAPVAKIASATLATELLTSDPAAQYLMDSLGIDHFEAMRRIKLQEAAGAFGDTAESSYPDTFGGLWLDQGIGEVVIAVADGQDSAALLSDARLHGLSQVRTVRVERSLTDLLNLREARVAKDEVGVASFVDIRRNQVVLGMDESRSATATSGPLTVEAGVAYDPALSQIKLENCVKPYCLSPLRAGVAIIPSTIPGNSPFCTNGFNVRSKSDGYYFAMTAAHCTEPRQSATWRTYFPDGVAHTLGPRHNDNFPGVDAAIINLLNQSGWAPAPRVVVWPGKGLTQNDNYGISGQAVAPLGGTVCMTGRVTASKCGTVEQFYVNVGDARDTVGVRMNVPNCTDGGDSGGPWWGGAKAYGIHTGGTGVNTADCLSYYTRIDDAMNSLNVRLVTTLNP